MACVALRCIARRHRESCFPVTPWVIVYCGAAVFLQNFFVCSVIEPVYYLILTSACYCCAFNWMRSMLLQVYSWDWQRIENHGQSAFCLLTFFFWAPLISFERECWLQPLLAEPARCDGRFRSSPEVSSPPPFVCSASLLYGCHNSGPACGLIGEDLHVC